MSRGLLYLLSLILILASAASTSSGPVLGAPGRQPLTFEVHFLDVGQGDGAILKTPNGRIVMIDAGPVGQGANVVAYLRAMGVTRVDAIAPSHAHADHVGGFLAVIDSFEVGEAWLTGQAANTTTWRQFQATQVLKVSEHGGGPGPPTSSLMPFSHSSR